MSASLIFLIVGGVIVLFFAFIVISSDREYERYIKRISDKNDIDKIENVIKHYSELIDSGDYTGDALEEFLDNLELWNQIRNYKLHGEIFVKDEDNIS